VPRIIFSARESGLVEQKSIEASQREHYDAIGSDYEAHYSDRWSLAYRDEFLLAPMFSGVELPGKKVLDAMCGGGQLAAFILDHGAEVWGLDISPVQVAALEKRCPEVKATVGSVFEMPFEDNSFDVVGICNALHHLHPHIDDALREIHRVLKPGGCFGFSEPHCPSLPDMMRKVWYRMDPLFEESEAAVDIGLVKSQVIDLFDFEHEVFCGNVAYIAVLNSMVLRLPLWLKPYYSPFLFKVERFLNRVLPSFLSCAVVCSWRKKG
jgi:ubiquinone/menaquinone biosynthesis C-methylase UbiE